MKFTIAELFKSRIPSLDLAKAKVKALGEEGLLAQEKKVPTNKSHHPLKVEENRPKPVPSRDWSSSIKEGADLYEKDGLEVSDAKIYKTKPVRRILQKWGESCGGPEAEIMALAIYEVLGDQFDLDYPIHRFGTCRRHRFNIARDVFSILRELNLPRSVWFNLCQAVGRIYGHTQAFYRNYPHLVPSKLYRGISKMTLYENQIEPRIVESWTRSKHIGIYFATRVTDYGILLETRRIDPCCILASYETRPDMVNRDEDEYLFLSSLVEIEYIHPIGNNEDRSNPYYYYTDFYIEDCEEFRIENLYYPDEQFGEYNPLYDAVGQGDLKSFKAAYEASPELLKSFLSERL